MSHSSARETTTSRARPAALSITGTAAHRGMRMGTFHDSEIRLSQEVTYSLAAARAADERGAGVAPCAMPAVTARAPPCHGPAQATARIGSAATRPSPGPPLCGRYLSDAEPHDLLLLGAQRVVQAHQERIRLQVHRLHRHLALLGACPSPRPLGGPTNSSGARGPCRPIGAASGEASGAARRKGRAAHGSGSAGVPPGVCAAADASGGPAGGGRAGPERDGPARSGLTRLGSARGPASGARGQARGGGGSGGRGTALRGARCAAVTARVQVGHGGPGPRGPPARGRLTPGTACPAPRLRLGGHAVAVPSSRPPRHGRSGPTPAPHPLPSGPSRLARPHRSPLPLLGPALASLPSPSLPLCVTPLALSPFFLSSCFF